MNSYMKAALCGAFLVTPITAAAYDCSSGVRTHNVRVQYQGFFPSVVYVCAGDTITFTNHSGATGGFKISDGGDSNTSHDFNFWQNNGQSASYVVNANSGTSFVDFSLSGYSTNYDGHAGIVFGSAPTHY